jgi:hypothetical protein
MTAPTVLFEQVLADVADELPDLEGLLLDQLGTFQSFRAQLLELHQFCIRQNHADPVIQIVQPLSDALFIHNHLI